jgi:hypothetical protein
MRRLWPKHKKTIVALVALIIVFGVLLLLSDESFTSEFKYTFY